MNKYDAIVADWKDFTIPKPVKRNLTLDLDNLKDLIVTISGPRRAGKTYFMFQLIHQLMDVHEVDRENIFYVNLEDDRLFPFTTTDMDMLLEKYQESFGISREHDIYLFLDEIQNIENWAGWVRRVHDLRRDIRFILTGSSSKLLGSEIASGLRGRTYNLTVYPVSFAEYLTWKEIPPVATMPSSTRKVEFRRWFNDYLAGSAFPQFLFGNYDRELKRQLLQGYYGVMLLRDIIDRHSIRNVTLLKMLGKLLFGSISREFSYTKLHNSLKSLGVRVSKNTIIDYIGYFEDVFLFFQNPSYSTSYRAQMASIKKIYCVDTGLIGAVSFRSSEDREKFLENLVYIELKRRGKDIYYHRGKRECDFLVKEGLNISQVIQVAASLDSQKTRDREIKGLVEAMLEYELSEGLILTEDDFEDIESEGCTIRIRPVWYWLQRGEQGRL